MPRHYGRDPFARGEYHRFTKRMLFKPIQCEWDGQERKTLYTFVWEPDDGNRCPPRFIGGLKFFCNMSCWKAYYGV